MILYGSTQKEGKGSVTIPGFLRAGLGFCGVGWTLMVKLHGVVTIPFVHKAMQFL